MKKTTRHLALIDDRLLQVTEGRTASTFAAFNYDWNDFRAEFKNVAVGGNRWVIDNALKKFLEHYGLLPW